MAHLGTLILGMTLGIMLPPALCGTRWHPPGVSPSDTIEAPINGL